MDAGKLEFFGIGEREVDSFKNHSLLCGNNRLRFLIIQIFTLIIVLALELESLFLPIY